MEQRISESNTETVRTVSGSKWGATSAIELEIELEIGIAEGDWRYMFTQPRAFWADGEQIFVLDEAEARVSVYDRSGTHLRSFGRPGPGPYELQNPVGLAVTLTGEVFVSGEDGGARARITVFDQAGSPTAGWFADPAGERVRVLAAWLRLTDSGLAVGVTQIPLDIRQQGFSTRFGWQFFNEEFAHGDPWFAGENPEEPATLIRTARSGFSLERPVPFSVARPIIAVSNSGDVIWGYPHRYSFRIEHVDGTVTIVERATEATAVNPEEAEYYRRLLVMNYQRGDPSFSWDGATMPSTKPWYSSFHIDDVNRLWVAREVASDKVQGCTPIDFEMTPGTRVPCWRRRYEFDIFELDGSYLGAIVWPPELDLITTPFFGDATVVGYHETITGTPTVRVYRMRIPSE